jgi:hypothetical protein
MLIPSRITYIDNLPFLGHHDPVFSTRGEYHFNANTLKNTVDHLRDIHFLEEQGDIWRIRVALSTTGPAQPSGQVDRSYPFDW